MTQLTALERDLLACVERLVTASEASAKDLTALEHSFTGRIHEGLERIAERRGELQVGERELAAELDLSEGRRREIEGRLDSQEAHAERGLRH